MTEQTLLLLIGAGLALVAIAYDLGVRHGIRAAMRDALPSPADLGIDTDEAPAGHAPSTPAERPPLTCLCLDGSQLAIDALQAHVIYCGTRADVSDIDRAVRQILAQRD